MNYMLDQYYPQGLTYVHRTIDYDECYRLCQALSVIKYKKTKDHAEKLEYGIIYDKDDETYRSGKKIPSSLAKLYKKIKKRLQRDNPDVANMKMNNMSITKYTDESYMKMHVDSTKLGDELIYFVIGGQTKYSFINLKSAKMKFDIGVYNGTSMYIKGEARYLWAHSMWSMPGTRWLLTFRHIPSDSE